MRKIINENDTGVLNYKYPTTNGKFLDFYIDTNKLFETIYINKIMGDCFKKYSKSKIDMYLDFNEQSLKDMLANALTGHPSAFFPINIHPKEIIVLARKFNYLLDPKKSFSVVSLEDQYELEPSVEKDLNHCIEMYKNVFIQLFNSYLEDNKSMLWQYEYAEMSIHSDDYQLKNESEFPIKNDNI